MWGRFIKKVESTEAYFGKSAWLPWCSLFFENRSILHVKIRHFAFSCPVRIKGPLKFIANILKNKKPHEIFQEPGLKMCVPVEHRTIVPVFWKTLDFQWRTYSSEHLHRFFFYVFNILSKCVHGDFNPTVVVIKCSAKMQ